VADICLKHDLLRWGTDDRSEPPPGGQALIGPACVTDIVPEQAGCETARGVLQIAAGICTCPHEGAHGFIFPCGDIDRGEIARAGQAGQ
jgi:hypothetical protein